MNKEDIERIIQAQGYRCEFKECLSERSNGNSWFYVYAWTRGKPKIGRSLGRLEEVMKLDQDEFARIIPEAFTKKRRR